MTEKAEMTEIAEIVECGVGNRVSADIFRPGIIAGLSVEWEEFLGDRLTLASVARTRVTDHGIMNLFIINPVPRDRRQLPAVSY